MPPRPGRDARGFARTESSTPPGTSRRGSATACPPSWGRGTRRCRPPGPDASLSGGGDRLEQLQMAGDQRAQLGLEAGPLPLQLVDVVHHLDQLLVRGVDDLLRLELGLGDDNLRLLLRRVAEVLRDALGGDQRLLQGALALEVALQLYLRALELFLERDVLPHHVLELRSQELQEPLHVTGGVAAEGGLEALLPDVERGELHGPRSLAEPRKTPRNRLHGRRKARASPQH